MSAEPIRRWRTLFWSERVGAIVEVVPEAECLGALVASGLIIILEPTFDVVVVSVAGESVVGKQLALMAIAEHFEVLPNAFEKPYYQK